MNSKPFATLLLSSLLSLSLSQSAQAQAPQVQATQAMPASWNSAALSHATYVILPPQLEGNASVVSQEQQVSILDAMKRDSAGAILRRYPTAQFSTDAATPGAVRVTPVLVAPAALTPWAKMNARMDIQLPEGRTVSLTQSFSVLTLWQQGWNAANYAYDQVATQLPQ